MPSGDITQYDPATEVETDAPEIADADIPSSNIIVINPNSADVDEIGWKALADVFSLLSEDVSIEYAETDSADNADWHETKTDDDEFLRIGIGDPVVYTVGIPLTVGGSGVDVVAEYAETDSADDADWHETKVAADEFLRIGIGDPPEYSVGIPLQALSDGDGITIDSDGNINITDSYINALIVASDQWVEHFRSSYVSNANFTSFTGNRWTAFATSNPTADSHRHTIDIYATSSHRPVLNALLAGAKIQVRNVDNTVRQTFTLAVNPADPISGVYQLIGAWDNLNPFFVANTNYTLYFSQSRSHFQANWDEDDTEAPDYIRGKPTSLLPFSSQLAAIDHVDRSSLDGSIAQWALHQVALIEYIEFDGLNDDDQALIESAIVGSKFGFYIGNDLHASGFVSAVYDATNGIAIDFDEEGTSFSTSETYTILFTQARPGEDGGGGTGTQGAQGRFTKFIYRNATATPTTPSDSTYTIATEAFTDIDSHWSETITTPTGSNRTYRVQAEIDPDTDDTTITVSWGGLIPISAVDGADGTGTQGAQGIFTKFIYRNAGTSPSVPSDGTFTVATGAFTDIVSGWTETPSTPSSSQRTYRVQANIDPDTDDATISVTWGGLLVVSGRDGEDGAGGGGDGTASTQRAERVTLQAVAAVTDLNKSAAINVAATSPISITYPTGETESEMLSATAGAAEFTFAKAGIYPFVWEADVDVTEPRPIPQIEIFGAADTIGTDAPIGRAVGQYIRIERTDQEVYAHGELVIEADDTDVKVAVSSIVEYGTSSDGVPEFAVDAGSTLTFYRLGDKGDKGDQGDQGDTPAGTDISGKADVDLQNVSTTLTDPQKKAVRDDIGAVSEGDVEDIAAERVQHTIRRRIVILAGTLENGDMRINASSLEVKNGNDTAEGWFNDLPVGTRVKIRGQSSGTVRIGTLNSVTPEANDVYELDLTFTSSSGHFTNHETGVVTFDEIHDPQSNWAETNDEAPDYVRNKPLVPIWLDAADVSRSGDVFTLSPDPAITTLLGGMTFSFTLATTNTGDVTVIISSLSAVTLRKSDASEFAASELPGNGIITIVYDEDHSRFVSDVDPASSGGTTDITGKADTNLGNVDDNIAAEDQAEFRAKVGIDIPIWLAAADVSKSGDNFTLSPDPAITELTAGLTFSWRLTATNSGAVGVIVSSLSPVGVRKSDNSQFASSELPSDGIIEIKYDADQNLFLSDVDPPVDVAGKADANLQNILSTLTASQKKIVRDRLDAQKEISVHTQNFRNAATTGRYVASSGNPNSIISAKLGHDGEVGIAETDGTVDFNHNNLRGNFYIANDVYNHNDNAGWEFTYVNVSPYDIHILPTDDSPRFVIEGALGPVNRVANDPDDHANSHPIILKEGQWVRLIFLSTDGTTHTFFGIGGGTTEAITSEAAEVEGDKVAELEFSNSDATFNLLTSPSEVSDTSYRGDGWVLSSNVPTGTEAFNHGVGNSPRLRLPLKRPAVNVSGLIFKVLTLEEISTLNGGTNTTSTNLSLTSAPDTALAVNDIIQIRYEKVKITGVNSATSFTMERGVDGTTASSHSHGAPIFAEEHEVQDELQVGWSATTEWDDDGNAIANYGLSYTADDANLFLRYVKPPTRHDAHLELILYADSDNGASAPARLKVEVYIAEVADSLDAGQEGGQIFAGNHINVTSDGAGDHTIAVSTADATTAEMEAGTQTGRRLLSPKNVADAIAALVVSTTQTASQIKTAYESNADTNAFTDGDESKLDGIETSATADQTASEIKTAYESNADTNAFTDADESKLDGIETSATADQTASEIKGSLETLTGDDRLGASAVKDIPSGVGRANVYAETKDIIVGGDGVTVTEDDTNDTLTIATSAGSDSVQRAESVTLQASGTLTGTTRSSAINIAASSPFSVIYPPSETNIEIISGTAGAATFRFEKAGIYGFTWKGQVNVVEERPVPMVEIFESGDTPGTDAPIGIAVGQYLRQPATDQNLYAHGTVVVDADDTDVEVYISSITTFSTIPEFSIDSASVLTFHRVGIKGDPGDIGPAGETTTVDDVTIQKNGTEVSLNLDSALVAADDGKVFTYDHANTRLVKTYRGNPVLELWGDGQDSQLSPRRDLGVTETDNVSVVKFDATAQRLINGGDSDIISFVDTADLPAGLDPPVYDATNRPNGVGDDMVFGLNAGTYNILYRGNTSVVDDRDLICRLCKVNSAVNIMFRAGMVNNYRGLTTTNNRIITARWTGEIQFFTHAGVEQTSENFDTNISALMGIAVTSDRIITARETGEIQFFTHAGVEQTSEAFDAGSGSAWTNLSVTSDRIITLKTAGEIQFFTHAGVEQTSEAFDAGSGGNYNGFHLTNNRIITATDAGEIQFFTHAGVEQTSENTHLEGISNSNSITGMALITDAILSMNELGEIVSYNLDGEPAGYDDDEIIGESIGIDIDETNEGLRNILKGAPFEIRGDYIEVEASDRFYIGFDRFDKDDNNNVGGYLQITDTS